MWHRNPVSVLPTHSVANQPPDPGDQDLFAGDTPLREALVARLDGDLLGRVAAFGAEAGRRHWFDQGDLANRHPPELMAFDRQGRRLDEVRYHPAYHALMALAIGHGVHSVAWRAFGRGGHVAHVAMIHMLTQPEQGVCCPLVMTHAAVPALRHAPDIAAAWEPGLLADRYDPESRPSPGKRGLTCGMAMTEKQGGSDVRANTTEARRESDGWRLTGHKWFCSAPMSDAFLTLAQTPEGLSCFLVPRWTPAGERNAIRLQRLKDKCGNRSNASAEIEYHGAWAAPVGDSGRGVRTIIEMVQQTRLDAAAAPVGMMRQALVQALHHVAHREAFGARLADQPLMRAVLADLALDVEAGTALVMRVAQAHDSAGEDESERRFARVATAVAKFWTNKRAPQAIYEAMECLGGGGYVEESLLSRLYREAPVNSIWEGSGNVICLDVLRALERDPDAAATFLAEVERGRGGHPLLDRCLDRLARALKDPADAQSRARHLVTLMALALQASLLIRGVPDPVGEAFCEARLGADAAPVYGAAPAMSGVAAVLERARPA